MLQGKLKAFDSSVEAFISVKMADKYDLEKWKVLMQNFIDSILASEDICGSEVVSMFFTSSWEFNKDHVKRPTETKFIKLKKMFTNSENKKSKQALEDLLLLDNDTEKSVQAADDLAEPLYALISEIYELKGVFKWFRRSLITIAYISFGGTISRKLVDTVQWLVGDTMMVSYFNTVKDLISGTGSAQLNSYTQLTDQERKKVREEARKLWLSKVPDIMVKVVGLQTARQGTEKIFESFQDQKLNKHLFYDLLEHFLHSFIPELGK